VLGNDVQIETYGLAGRLSGSVSASSDPSGIGRGAGELKIEEGKYTAYGRKLDIERGRLIFSGGLVSDPGVDIRAVKKFPDLTAGVNVRGKLRNPQLGFFSDPSLPQSQIVSILVAGGTIESLQTNSSSTAQVGLARNELLAQGGALVAQQIGARLGLEDISIESNAANQTSLVLGKFLNPRLYVSYGVSLAESINTVKLRYTLGDRWTIKTEAGENRSADLVYTIER
jgi:translocation and assembly module TamB